MKRYAAGDVVERRNGERWTIEEVNTRGRPTFIRRPGYSAFFGSAEAFRQWLEETPRAEQRRTASELQARAEELRDGLSDEMRRGIRATDHGWVEIRAEYLAHLLDRIEHNAAHGGGG